ncbi:hypothetical protein BDF14DRAFT_1727918 [Spinellus fusiger]|nr:hypothetical protein BDF14DRAFT_1727918 [Spinellus fusiger]
MEGAAHPKTSGLKSHCLWGHIKHRRKLCKDLFFVDIQPLQGDKVQVLFRLDGSMEEHAFHDAYRTAHVGDKVEVWVGPPNDPLEANKPYTVYQSNTPICILETYPRSTLALSDPPLRTPTVKNTAKQWDGREERKENIDCKYWINQCHCPRADCLFRHPTGEAYERARAEWLQHRNEVRHTRTLNPNDPHTNKNPHSLRAVVFAKWIQHTFQPQGHILDIAGGKGEVAMVLSRGYGLFTSVIEPKERKRPAYWYNRLRRLLQAETWHAIEPDYYPVFLDTVFIQQHSDLLQRTCLLIGLHSDQATELIVDYALALNKAFAVVPCCVFHHENRHRRRKNGLPVSTTEEFIEYLMEKESRDTPIQAAYLDFEGKNRVIYWQPSSLSL